MADQTNQRAGDNATQIGRVGKNANIYNFHYNFFVLPSYQGQLQNTQKPRNIYRRMRGKPFVKTAMVDVISGAVLGVIIGMIIGLIDGLIAETDIVDVTRWILMGSILGLCLGVVTGLASFTFPIRDSLVLEVIRSIRRRIGIRIILQASIKLILQTPISQFTVLLFGHRNHISKWKIVRGTIFGAHSIEYYGELISENQEHLGLDFVMRRSIIGAIGRGVTLSLVIGVGVGWMMSKTNATEFDLIGIIFSGAVAGTLTGIILVIFGWKLLDKMRFQSNISAGYRY